jgi:acyl-[acyl-carrier-protein]-phospholipid O-acyltransferase / long-chain-fatty-acid--[acyl-carrier-protein] ligase
MAASSYTKLLKSVGFQSFLWTQFLGAYNDNVYKILVSLLAVEIGARTGKGSQYLSLSGAIFIVPFLLFSGYSGHLADVFNKRRVLIATKSLEVISMGLAIPALVSQRVDLMMAVLFLLALQSTLFSPAKYGILPEMLPDRDLSRANGLLEMSTFVAIVVGTSSGTFLFSAWKQEPWKMGAMMLAIAVVGTLMSFKIGHVASPAVRAPFALNPFAEVFTGMKRLYSDRPLWLTVIGMSYFWFLGALFQMDLILIGREVMKLDEMRVGLMLTALAVGIGVGSMAAGRLSGDKVELGLVPLGSLGMGASSMLLCWLVPSWSGAIVALALLGFSSGLFIVPLNAFLQQRSEENEKGRLIATNNFLNMVGILLASAALWGLHDKAGVAPDKIVLYAGIFTVAATVYSVSVVPDFLVRFMLWMLTHTLFRIRIVGAENVPFRGPALLVANHVSHVDGFLIGACVQRFIRFMVYRPYYEIKALNWFFRLTKAIPVGTGSRRDIVQSLLTARHELEAGHVVCIFAEGAISRTGNLLPFKRGLERIVDGLDLPVIPVHLDRLWGSIFSFERGRFFWKWPKRVPYPVTVSFGRPLTTQATAQDLRLAIMELGSEAVDHRRTLRDLLHLRFIRSAKRHWFSFAMADSSGKELTYGQALVASLLLAKWIRRHGAPAQNIGLLLPNSVGGALANVATLMAGKIPVNLNYTAGREAMASAIEQCAIRKILTSKLFLAKAKLEPVEEMIYLEEILRQFSSMQKILVAAATFLLPTRLIESYANREQRGTDSLATVIFSSGSTGTPKGVMLSHQNLISNIEAVGQVFWINRTDRIVGVLPFFHSFGFTHTLWFPLVAGAGAVYHPNPMDAKSIGELVRKYRGTLLLTTPTFCAGYTRKCYAEEFTSLRYVLVGAEKLRESIAAAFREKFGLSPLEGYGATEMSPVIAVNVPDHEEPANRQTGGKPGTVGHPLPGVTVEVVDLDTGERVPAGKEGLLLIKGPNRMLGYLGQPEKTADVMKNGWYVTGDIGCLDDDGFIRVTDRVSRFSKIGGEMVPHVKIEEAIQQILGEFACAVTGVPDEQKGERLVAFYTRPDLTPVELWQRLAETDLPKLWLPKRESLHSVEALPMLGTGKLDLRKLKMLAEQVSDSGTAAL